MAGVSKDKANMQNMHVELFSDPPARASGGTHRGSRQMIGGMGWSNPSVRVAQPASSQVVVMEAAMVARADVTKLHRKIPIVFQSEVAREAKE